MSSKRMSHGSSGGFMVHDYEFSCSNSPNPVFFHKRNKHNFNFPCINVPDDFEVEVEVENNNVVKDHMVIVPKTPEYRFNFEFGTGERKSPLLSPFSVRVSNYSALEGIEEVGNDQVDDQAEDFIKRFYEQLRTQSRMQLLQYQDM